MGFGSFDKDGRQISDAEVCARTATPELFEKNYRVAATEVGGTLISTVLLAYSDAVFRFETMVFHPEDKGLEAYGDRYASEEEAKAGHERVVAMVRKSMVDGHVVLPMKALDSGAE